NLYLPRPGLGQLFNYGLEHSARPAPDGGEVHQHRLLCLQHFTLKRRLGNLLDFAHSSSVWYDGSRQVIVTPGLYKSRVAGSPDFTILSGRTMESLLLTFYRLRDRMHSAISAEQSWARSSTAEQWPFKPLV